MQETSRVLFYSSVVVEIQIQVLFSTSNVAFRWTNYLVVDFFKSVIFTLVVLLSYSVISFPAFFSCRYFFTASFPERNTTNRDLNIALFVIKKKTWTKFFQKGLGETTVSHELQCGNLCFLTFCIRKHYKSRPWKENQINSNKTINKTKIGVPCGNSYK